MSAPSLSPDGTMSRRLDAWLDTGAGDFQLAQGSATRLFSCHFLSPASKGFEFFVWTRILTIGLKSLGILLFLD
jgi:hypothetical protein